MDELESFLNELHLFANDSVKTEGVMKKIFELLMNEKSGDSISILIFLIFGEKGIIPYVKRSFISEENRRNIFSAFELLQYLIVNYESFVAPYVYKVEELCLGIVQSNATAKIKENCVKLLKCLFVAPFLVLLNIPRTIAAIINMKGKVPATVKSELFSLMGIIFEKVPEISHSEKDQFLEIFFEEMGLPRKSVTTMEGCFNGINGYLVNFLPERQKIYRIYLLLKEHCFLKMEEKRRVMKRSALRIMERHYRIFAVYIYDDIKFWQKNLEIWMKKTTKDRRLAFNATVSVYRAIAHIFETSNAENATGKLNEIVEEMLDRMKTNFKIASMVAVVELVSTGYVREELANRVLHLVKKRVTIVSDNLMYLPLNLECVTKYMTRSKTVNPELLLLVEKMAITLIDNYPRMETDFRHRFLESLEKSFHHLRQCGFQVFEEYVNEVVYQGLVRNCSRQILSDIEILRGIADVDAISYKSYLPLWLYLLNQSSSGCEVISEKIFDGYVSAFMKINKKLDLRIEMKYRHVTDPEEAGEAIRPNDFKIFINNVHLFVDIVEGIKNPELMSKWLPLIFTETLNFSYKSPLISGFYKVITSCLKVADKIDYFWDSVTVSADQIADCESRQWFRYLQMFLHDLSLRVGRYKGELQISCFQIFLWSHMHLIEPFLRNLVPIFRVILRVGSSHVSLLRDCLSTLDRWYASLGRHDSSSKESMEYLLKNILPYFNMVLQSNESESGLTEAVDEKWTSFKINGKVQKLRSSGSESELLILQRKFLIFLGRLDYDVCKELIESCDDNVEGDEYGVEGMEEWNKKLCCDVPFSDGKLRINIDELLPRVVQLSLSSIDRQTRLYACEFLHSIVLVIIGNMKQLNGELNELFRKLVPACLMLGCDSDLIVFQIFEPLMMQMAHYFANRINETSREFINCLMECASHPFNPTLRDFAAKLIREFTEWCVRDTDPGELHINVKIILGIMNSFSVHPDHNKRCGAAIVFNNICSIIQEETDVLNSHWFLMYFHFMESLSMCMIHDDTTHIVNAVEFITTSVSEKSFTPRVKIPPGFADNSMDSILENIFSRCTHPQKNIRTLSMALYEVVGEYGSSVKEFVRIHGSVVYMKHEYPKENGSVKDYVDWLDYNVNLFSFYDWLLIHSAVTETDLKKAGIEILLGNFLDHLNPVHPWFEIHAKMISAIVQMLQFLTSCIQVGFVWHKRKLLALIKTCLFAPSHLKLELSDMENREKLNLIFAKLLPCLVDRLNNEELSFLLDLRGNFLSLHSHTPPDKRLCEMVELVKGLETMRNLELWNLGFDRIVSGDEIIQTVFQLVFHVGPSGTFSTCIKPSDKILLEDLMRFGAKIGISMDDLFDLLKNTEEVYDVNKFVKTTKGEFFMNLFSDSISDYMISKCKVCLNVMFEKFRGNALKTIVSLLKHTDLVNSNGGKFLAGICERWHLVEQLTDNNVLLLPVVKDMCLADPNLLAKENRVCLWVCQIMKTTSSLEEIGFVFELLPYLTVVHEDSNDNLTSSLNAFYQNQNFFSPEISPCDPRVLIAYEGLSKGFIRTKSLPALREIIKMMTKYGTLLNEHEMNNTFDGGCLTKVPDQHVQKLLSFLYRNAVESDAEESPICQRFLEKLLQICERETAWNFLLENLYDAAKALRCENISLKIAVLKMVQACLAGVKRENLEKLPEGKKEAFRELIRICFKIEFLDGEHELRRKYFCECFNTLCTVIVARTNDPVQYKCLIFKDDFSVLSKLIDRDKVWSLRMDFDELPKMRKVITSLRKTITRERQMRLGESVNSVNYLEEETNFDSSLKEDMTRFDFTSSFLRSGTADDRDETGLFRLELEMDDLNKHECMAIIIGVIRHMVHEKIISEDVESAPFWLLSLLRRMTSLNSSENEKIFLLKLFCNIDEYVKPYAVTLIPDLLNTLLEVFHEKPINYLVVDLITMILNWKTDLSSLGGQIQSIITRLAMYIVKKSNSYRKDIIDSNIELLKLIIESNKDIMNVQVLSAKAFEGLKTTDGMTESTIYVNLHFCGVLLANSIPPWSDNKEEEFILSVLPYCQNNRNIGKLAAQICGLTLCQLEDADHADRLVEMVRDKIQHGLNSNGFNDLSLVYSVHKNYQRISSCFVGSLQTCAWTVTGPFRVHSLEMLLSHVRRLKGIGGDAFATTIHNFLEDMCSTDDLEALGLSLQIAEVVLGLTDSDRMDRVIEKILTHGECKAMNVRRIVYNIAIAISEGWEHRYSKNMQENTVKKCKVLLLNGMNDKDLDCREKCVEFWYRKTLGLASSQRFSTILRDVYTAETEKYFLNFATRLIIRSSTESPDYETLIFEHPLVQNSPFRVRNILKTVQPSMIAPMFAQTLTGQLSKPGLLQSLSSVPSSLQTLLVQGTTQPEVENSLVLKADVDESSKRTKRFVRDPKKNQLYFAKKKRMKEALGWKNKNDTAVKLLMEYCDGDYPNIQITHGDLLKPLEMLTVKDPQIGRYFLTSMCDAIVRKSPDKSFFENINQLVEQVMGESTENDPSFVAFLFNVLLRCNGTVEADSEWVARLAKSSGCLSLGRLLIEEAIIRKEWDVEDRDRRSGFTPEEMKWLNVAEICRELKEFQILRGIFLEKLRVVDDAADAIRSESFSNWFRAAELYESAMKRPFTPLSNFYEEAYSNCLARLSNWTKLANHLHERYNFQELCSDSGLSQKVLPWFVRSETMRSLLSDGGKSITEFIGKLDNIPEQVLDLKKYFPEEFAIAHFSQRNFEWLSYHLCRIYKNFLSSWPHWNTWSNSRRLTKLLELQLPWELESLRSTLSSSDGSVSDLLDQWSRNRPRDVDDLMSWDMRLACRNHFLSMLESLHPHVDVADILKTSVIVDFDMIKAGIAQRNVQLSEKYIRIMRERMDSCVDYKLRLMHDYCATSLEVLKVEMDSGDRDVRCIGYASAVIHLEEISEKNDFLSFESCIALSRITDFIQADIDNVSNETIQEIAPLMGMRLDSVKEDLKAKKLMYLKKALELASDDADNQSKTFMEMVKHYRTNVGYSTEMATFLLRAMNCGNAEAGKLFCCLLNEPKFATDWVNNSELRSVCYGIPAWMYLTWTNQILANLDSVMFPFLKEILLSLTEAYPNSVRYPFRLSRETYEYTNREYGQQCRSFVNELSRKLFSDPSHEDFLTALSYVAPPDLVFRYDLDVLISELNQVRPDWDRMQGIVRDLHERMYGEEYKNFRGVVYDCLGGLKSDLEVLLSLDREKCLWTEKVVRLMRAVPKLTAGNSTLKSYSPWLHRRTNLNATTFELPCRQNGDGRILNRSVTLWSFKSNLLVMNSKCRPARITVIGSDAREYKFLIKFGEDLRQEQRIQEVFCRMNQVLLGNQHKSALTIDTYNILPLKCNLGMIEWVNNTCTLYELLTQTDERVRETMVRVQREHLEFLGGNVTKDVDAHLNGYLKVDRTEAVARFSERVHSFEWDLLRKAFWRMSRCPEQFVVLRNNFAVSQAVIYVAHWLIGIGDRHLGNTLVSSGTGRALGIDFGYAFGFATEFLVPPELLPFRLTPQILNLIKPMGEHVFLKETMIQSLKTLRKGRSILIEAIDVFASEPTLTWLEKTKRDGTSRKDDSECVRKWDSREKIAAVRKKLEGINPVRIFESDLISGHSGTHYLEKCIQVLHGDGSRTRLQSLTEEEQIDCLLDLATDPHILSKSYIGWNSWL